MNLLDEKIKKCEEFITFYQNFRTLSMSDCTECDMEGAYLGLSEMMLRAKTAMVVKFFEEMGNVIDRDTLRKLNVCVEDWQMPDEDFICSLASLADPFTKVVSLHAMSSDCEACYCASANEALENLDAVDYAEYEDIFSPAIFEQMQTEDGLDFDALKEEQKWDILVNIVCHDMKAEMEDLPYFDDTLYDIAYDAVNAAACESSLFYYAEWDKLLPYFAKKYIKKNRKGHYSYSPRYEIKKRAGKNANRVLRLSMNAQLTHSYVEVFDCFHWDSNPMEVYVHSFGMMQYYYSSEPYDITKTDVLFPVIKALQHLYLFKCNRRSHFLPPEYENGDALIFPNYKVK